MMVLTSSADISSSVYRRILRRFVIRSWNEVIVLKDMFDICNLCTIAMKTHGMKVICGIPKPGGIGRKILPATLDVGQPQKSCLWPRICDNGRRIQADAFHSVGVLFDIFRRPWKPKEGDATTRK